MRNKNGKLACKTAFGYIAICCFTSVPPLLKLLPAEQEAAAIALPLDPPSDSFSWLRDEFPDMDKSTGACFSLLQAFLRIWKHLQWLQTA
eukprot:355629-Pleurochrysis_carterae.AAC.1